MSDLGFVQTTGQTTLADNTTRYLMTEEKQDFVHLRG